MSNSWATAPQLCLFLKDSCLYAMCRPTVRQLSRYDLFNLFWLHVQVPEIVLVCSWMRLYGTSMYSVVLKSWIVFFPRKLVSYLAVTLNKFLVQLKKEIRNFTWQKEMRLLRRGPSWHLVIKKMWNITFLVGEAVAGTRGVELPINYIYADLFAQHHL